jgi:methylphosphotriester-DNA--protein-cysteine methyltransferase
VRRRSGIRGIAELGRVLTAHQDFVTRLIYPEPTDNSRPNCRTFASIRCKARNGIERRARCNAIQVSERSLRMCCEEHLGMSPRLYPMQRRLNLAWRAVRAARPSEPGVTKIAMRFGFRQRGRLAVQHRSLFGKPPSATLCRPPD